MDLDSAGVSRLADWEGSCGALLYLLWVCAVLHALLHPRKQRTRAPVLTGSPGAAPGGRGICAYRGGSFPIAHGPCLSLCVCRHYATKVAVNIFPAQFSNTPNARIPPPRCPWATRPIHACHPKRLPLSAEGVCSKASKCKLPTTQNRHRRRHRRRHHPPVTVEGVRRGTRHLQAAEPRRCGKWGKGRAGLVEHRNERPGNTRVPPRLPLSDT